MKRPSVTCPTCKGHGNIQLSNQLSRCISAIKSLGQATVHQIHRRNREKVDITAINNRMRKLMALGFVRKVNKRRPFIFKAT